jgi:hypothetical protein
MYLAKGFEDQDIEEKETYGDVVKRTIATEFDFNMPRNATTLNSA